MDNNEKTLLNAVRPYGMKVPSSRALNISKSLHLTISYLLIGEQKDLESKSCSWMVKLRS